MLRIICRISVTFMIIIVANLYVSMVYNTTLFSAYYHYTAGNYEVSLIAQKPLLFEDSGGFVKRTLDFNIKMLKFLEKQLPRTDENDWNKTAITAEVLIHKKNGSFDIALDTILNKPQLKTAVIWKFSLPWVNRSCYNDYFYPTLSSSNLLIKQYYSWSMEGPRSQEIRSFGSDRFNYVRKYLYEPRQKMKIENESRIMFTYIKSPLWRHLKNEEAIYKPEYCAPKNVFSIIVIQNCIVVPTGTGFKLL